MHRLLDRLVLYSDLDRGGVLTQMGAVYRDLEDGRVPAGSLVARVNRQAKHLLDAATLYGFDGNLWQDYLAFVLFTNKNSFSLTAERRRIEKGSVTAFALADFEVFRQLFSFDFSGMERRLGVQSFSLLCDYRAVPKPERNYYRTVSQIVRGLSAQVAAAQSAEQVYDAVCSAYLRYGVGMFGLNRAFRIRRADACPPPAPPGMGPGPHPGAGMGCGPGAGMALEPASPIEFIPINNTDKVLLSDLVGYDMQKEQLVANTRAFLRGDPANNVLLYGDAGTGKSTSVKALLNEFYESGLRIIELYKHQFEDISDVIAQIKGRNYRFIIFIDDLSFEENEVEYKFLKAVIEGGLESRPENVLIYATSNRRHLIREVWSDRSDMEHDGDIHRSDTMQEKLSLAARFGVAINYGKPAPALYHEIVKELACRQLTDPPADEDLFRLADRWGIRHGGISGRAAQQFVDSLAGAAR